MMHQIQDFNERKNVLCDCSERSQSNMKASIEAHKRNKAFSPILINKEGASYLKLTNLIGSLSAKNMTSKAIAGRAFKSESPRKNLNGSPSNKSCKRD